MDEDKIRQIAQQVFDENSGVNQFAVSQTPYHTHNGADSPSFAFTNLKDVPSSYATTAAGNFGRPVVCNFGQTTAQSPGGSRIPSGLQFAWYAAVPYIGNVNSDGTAGAPFPSDRPGVNPRGGTGPWSVAHTGTGDYTVTHNLGITSYVVMAVPFTNQSRSAIVVARSTNSFEVVIFNTGTGAATDTAFFFTLLV